MSCERYREALAEVAAGAPAGPEIDNHLAACEGCRAELGALRQALVVADAELRQLLAAEASPALAARIRRAVAQAPGSSVPAWRLGWRWPAVAIAATLLVAIAVWVSGRGTPTPAPNVSDTAAHPSAAPSPLTNDQPPALTGAAPSGGSHSGRLSGEGVRRTAAVPVEPEVLVPADQAAAIIRFAAALQEAPVTGTSLLVADLAAPLAELPPIDIAPLGITPPDPENASGPQEGVLE